MRKLKLPLLLLSFIGFTVLTNCGETELDSIECGEYIYKVTKLAIEGTTQDGQQTVSSFEIKVYAQDANGNNLATFREAIEVSVSATNSYTPCLGHPCSTNYQPVGTVTVPVNSPSPTTIMNRTEAFITASIISPSCPDPLEKSQEDIDKDSEETECGGEGVLTVTEERCFTETIISWESDLDLDGATFTNYGVTIDLSEGSSKTFATEDLDFEDTNDSPITGVVLCSYNSTLIACPATCDDGIQNGDEEGIDCGGSCGNTCQADSGITYAGTPLDITYASYIDFISVDGNMIFTLTNDENVPYIDITLNSSEEFVSETYTVGSDTYSVDTDLSSINASGDMNGAVPFTSGSVVLTIGTESYTLDINLTTSEGTLSGTYDVPFGD